MPTIGTSEFHVPRTFSFAILGDQGTEGQSGGVKLRAGEARPRTVRSTAETQLVFLQPTEHSWVTEDGPLHAQTIKKAVKNQLVRTNIDGNISPNLMSLISETSLIHIEYAIFSVAIFFT